MMSEVWTDERVQVIKEFLEVEQMYCSDRSHENFEAPRYECNECVEALCTEIEQKAMARGDDLDLILKAFQAEIESRREQLRIFEERSGGEKERLYHEVIHPKVEEIRNLCVENDIPFWSLFQLDENLADESEHSYLVSSAFCPEQCCPAFEYIALMIKEGPNALVDRIMRAKLQHALGPLLGKLSNGECDGDCESCSTGEEQECETHQDGEDGEPSFLIPFVGEG